MKYANISSRNDLTGQMENEGKAMLITCMDKTELSSFWEYKLLEDSTIHCGWVENSRIFEE